MTNPARLSILYVSHKPASPPRSGGQVRIHAIMNELSKRHDLTAVMLVDDEFDIEECRQAMQAYCRNVVLVPNHHSRSGLAKRLAQLRSIASTRSFERQQVMVPALRDALHEVMHSTRFDIVNLEFSFLGYCNLRQAAPQEKPPAVVVDSHNIDYEIARQYAQSGSNLSRRLYEGINWRKLRTEELKTYGDADGVYLCSTSDQRRVLDEIPGANTAVIPNAADVEYYQPRETDPRPERNTLLFFGLLSYVPNVDGLSYFIQEIWPHVTKANPDARLKIVGANPPASLRALAGQNIEFTGFVPDLRPHLAAAAAVVVPLRLGGGTRLKIVEAMAMGKAIVSTTLGAEGIDAVPGRDILIADQPESFAAEVNRLLADPGLATDIGQSARQLAVQRYSWKSAVQKLEQFYRQILQVEPKRQRPRISAG